MLLGKIVCVSVSEMFFLIEGKDLTGFIDDFTSFPGNVAENIMSNHLPFH